MNKIDRKKFFWLIIMYVAFFILGVPHSVFSGIWTLIANSLNVKESNLGFLMSIYLIFNIIFLTTTSIIIDYIGEKKTIAIGISSLTMALILFTFTKSYYILIISMILMGIGNGLTDTTVSYYIATNYEPKYLTWLHCMWGIGSATGPYIVGLFVLRNYGYVIPNMIFVPLCLIVVIVFIISDIKDNKNKLNNYIKNIVKTKNKTNFSEIFAMKNVVLFLMGMFVVDFLLNAVSIWYCTYVTLICNIVAGSAAKMLSLYFVGLTLSRCICGFLVGKFGAMKLILIGIFIFLVANIFLILDIKNEQLFYIIALFLGIGVAPCYPLMINTAREIFGKSQLTGIIGLAGSFAQIGSCFASFLIAILMSKFTIRCFPYVTIIITILSYMLITRLKHKKNKSVI